MRIIATICARGGSTGLPGKNVKSLLAKPLIVHTIEQAKRHPLIDEVYVSTDDAQIKSIAESAGAHVPFLRPSELATNSAPKLPVIQHLVDFITNNGEQVDIIVDLDPTSPLRLDVDITACIEKLTPDLSCVLTAYKSDKNPYFNMLELGVDGCAHISKSTGQELFCRQDAPSVYSINGSVYVWWRNTLTNSLWKGKVTIHEMQRENSIDIDSELDFKLVELLMLERQQSQHKSQVEEV
jgi:CMP-N-acetylneuraminic acid synthetase